MLLLLGGRKPDPVSNRSAHKKYHLSQYTLLKLSYAYPVLVYLRTDSLFGCVSSYIHKNSVASRARRRWCRDRGPVINIVVPARTVAGAEIAGPVINIVVPHAPSLVPRSRACHKHCGLEPGGKPGVKRNLCRCEIYDVCEIL